MKNIIFIFSLLSSTFTYCQTPVKAGVYSNDWLKTDSHGQHTILTGETRFFHTYELSSITFQIKNKELPSLTVADHEQVVIVNDGELKVTIGKENKILGRGGVAHVLPGDMFAFENGGRTSVSFYLMKYISRDHEDGERGKTNGGSVAIRWEDVEKKTTDKGFSRVFYNHPTSMTTKFDMHATTLKAGVSSHAPHTHAEEEIVLILRGKGRMNIDGKFYDVAPGQLIYLSSEISHAIENSGADELEYFAFQWK
jgi:(S)-ureidoglycine aminohydrolase